MAHSVGTASTRTSSSNNPIAASSFTIDRLDTVVVLLLKVVGATDRTGGSPTFGGFTMLQPDITRKGGAGAEASVELWYLLNPPQGSWVCSIPNAGGLTIFYTLITGRAAAGGRSALDVFGGASSTGTANPAPGSLTTTQDGNMGFSVFAHGATDADPAVPAGTGFGTGTGTPLGTFDDGNHGGGQQYHLQATRGAFNLGWSLGVSDDWGCTAAYFKEVLPPVFENYKAMQAGTGISVTEKIR